jgi:predicted amidohydrolase YtcJ
MIMPTFADLVLLEGKIVTMNPKQPCAEAVAVKAGNIIRVGSNERVQKCIGEKTKVIRLNGKTVLPGLIDTHIHICDYGRLLLWLDLEGADSIQQIQTLLSQRAKQSVKGKWIVGRGWDQKLLKEKRLPTRLDLDAVSPQNPVVLYHESGQMCIVNSKALRLAKVNQQNQSGIDKDEETGEPTGVLHDDTTNLVWRAIPQPSEDELYEASISALKKAAAAGLTSVHWIVLSEIEITIIKRLVASGKLLLRVYLIVPMNLLAEALLNFKSLESGYFKLGGAVIFADGYLASRTAALSKPYSDSPHEKGKLLCSEAEMLRLVEKIEQAGLQVVIHAVGDEAISAALNVLEKAKTKSMRPRLEQAAVLNKQLIGRIRKLGGVVSVQPCVVASEFAVWSAEEHLGERRARWLFPLKTLVDCGVKVAAGSDCPMEPLNPMLGVQSAATREAYSEERVSVEEALRCYTVDAAYAGFEEKLKGSIDEGKLADFTVVKKDPQTTSVEKIKDVKIEFSIVNGKILHA